MFSPDPIHAGWEVSNGFCVAGATILMPLRWSPLTLYNACWEGSQVIDSDFVWPRQYFQCLREVLCDPMFGDTGDPTCFLCGRCSILDGSEKFPCVYVLLVWQVQYFRHLREGHRDTARSSPWHKFRFVAGSFLASEQFCVTLYVRFVWQAQYFSMLPNIFCATWTQGSLVTPPPFCAAGAIHWRQWWPYFLFVWQVQYFRCLGEVSRDPISILCGRCYMFDAFEKFSWPGPRGRLWLHLFFCVAGLREVLLILPKVGCDPTSFLCGMCNNLAAFWPYPPPWKSHKWPFRGPGHTKTPSVTRPTFWSLMTLQTNLSP